MNNTRRRVNNHYWGCLRQSKSLHPDILVLNSNGQWPHAVKLKASVGGTRLEG